MVFGGRLHRLLRRCRLVSLSPSLSPCRPGRPCNPVNTTRQAIILGVDDERGCLKWQWRDDHVPRDAPRPPARRSPLLPNSSIPYNRPPNHPLRAVLKMAQSEMADMTFEQHSGSQAGSSRAPGDAAIPAADDPVNADGPSLPPPRAVRQDRALIRFASFRART